MENETFSSVEKRYSKTTDEAPSAGKLDKMSTQDDGNTHTTWTWAHANDEDHQQQRKETDPPKSVSKTPRKQEERPSTGTETSYSNRSYNYGRASFYSPAASPPSNDTGDTHMQLDNDSENGAPKMYSPKPGKYQTRQGRQGHKA